MIEEEKRYFLKNSTLLEEIHKSKLSFCCYTNKEYTNYDIICDGYSMITPNVINSFFEKNTDRDFIIIRVITDEHVLPYIKKKNDRVNLQEIKMSPFKHFLLSKKDFLKTFKSCGCSTKSIDEKNNRIKELKEQIKDNKRSIRFNKLNKELQEPYKDFNKKCTDEIKNLITEIKTESINFSESIQNKMEEVLRSHWKGDTIETGEFCTTHGDLTKALVYMIMMMVDRFSKSGNWSGYTYLDDMKSSAIVQLYDVVLKFEEDKSSNPFAYMTQIISMRFTAILNSEKAQRKLKSTMLQELGYDPTFGEQTDEEYKYRMEEWAEQHQDNEIGNETDTIIEDY